MYLTEFDVLQIGPAALGVSEQRWVRYIEMMQDVGYRRACRVGRYGRADGGCERDVHCAEGLEYPQENGIMQRVCKAAKGIKEITPGSEPPERDIPDADVRAREQKMLRSGRYANLLKAQEAIGKELAAKGHETAFMQDIYGGAHGKPYPGTKWGHNLDYWRRGGRAALAREAFADLFEASFSPEKRKLAREYLPAAWAEFEKILGRV